MLDAFGAHAEQGRLEGGHRVRRGLVFDACEKAFQTTGENLPQINGALGQGHARSVRRGEAQEKNIPCDASDGIFVRVIEAVKRLADMLDVT
ncbi:MAG TPA: hypothetical protein VM580_15575, partial [Labilithrix sp.]|nr:hypothetical protein [Labilithrix sp.]